MVARSNSLPLLNRHLFAFARVFVCLPGACVFFLLLLILIREGIGEQIHEGFRHRHRAPFCWRQPWSSLCSSLPCASSGRTVLLRTHSHKKLNASLQDELGGKSSPLFFFSCRGKNGASVMTFSDKEQTCRSSSTRLIQPVSPIMRLTFSLKMYRHAV